jgi:tetratricopeptide (TPR) repeat protein
VIWTPAVGAALLGGVGWLLGPLWAVAGIVVGAVAALAFLLILVGRAKPDPALLLRSGRPQEAYRHLQPELAFVRTLVIRRPMFREILANRLETMAQVLQALDNEPKALETVTEAVTIYADLNVKDPERYGSALARALLRQAAMLADMGRHGEALAAAEPAVRIYRRLAVKDRSAHLPSLAAALTRQADELGYLDRITEARAATAEAEMISTDMLPSAQS